MKNCVHKAFSGYFHLCLSKDVIFKIQQGKFFISLHRMDEEGKRR